MLIPILSRSGLVTAMLILALLALSALPLAADSADSDVFASIRVYSGVDPADMQEITRITQAGFLPILQANPGFIAYYLLPAGDTLVAFNIFATEAEASASNAAAAGFVAENLAPLLPMAPQVFAGTVDVGAVNVMDKDWNDLYASARIYDGYDSSNHEALMVVVEEGFLPIIAGEEGFYGYFLMSDGADGAAAVSIHESEAAAMASNEAAKDFIAENMAEYVPNDPVIISGSLGIAHLDLQSFAKYVLGLDTFISIRVYEGLDPADNANIASITAEGFLPIMRGSDGFVGYFLLPAGDMLAAISIFDSPAQASASNEKARDFVAENLAPLLPNAPSILEGTVDVFFAADSADVQAGAPLFASLRMYKNVDLSHRAETNALIETIFLPIQQESGGLVAYLTMNDGISNTAALSVFQSEADALAVSEKAAAFVAEYLRDRPDEAPIAVRGQLGVAALAELAQGANLAAPMTDG